MTDELTKTFFDAFGIEAKSISTGECKYKITPEFCESDCLDCKNAIKEKTYPQITDRILLELICIANEQDTYPSTTNMNNIKARTLKMLLGALKFSAIYTESPNRRRLFIKRVRTLFEEG